MRHDNKHFTGRAYNGKVHKEQIAEDIAEQDAAVLLAEEEPKPQTSANRLPPRPPARPVVAGMGNPEPPKE
jgi:hypothetical protein